jgi:PAS domain S-box-containing protein
MGNCPQEQDLSKKQSHPNEAANSTAQARRVRQQAEAKFSAVASKTPARPSSEETQPMLHELEVHQIELEMQNEALRRTQSELEAARARYFDLFDLAPLGYVMLSEKGLILEANLTAAKMLGADKHALDNQPLMRFIVPEDQDIYYLRRKQLFETGMPQTCELRLTQTDTAPFWAKLEMATAAKDADGAPACRLLISDITAHKQEAVTQRESEEKYRLLAENVSDVIWILDVETRRYRYVSPSVEQLLGYTVEAVLAQDLTAVLAPVSRQLVQKTMPAAIARFQHGEREVSTTEIEQPRRDGTTVWTEVTSRFVSNPVTGRLEVVGVSRDITARKQMEARLQENEARLTALIENIDSSIWSLDRDYRLLASNARFRQNARIGLGHEIATGDNVLDGFPAAIRGEWQNYFDRSLRGEAFSLVTDTVPPLARRFVEYHFTPIVLAGGQVAGVTIFGNDITEIKQAEARIHGLNAELEARVRVRTAELSARTAELDAANQALREGEARFRSLAEATFEGIVITENGLIVDANEQFAQMYGYPQSEVVGMPLAAFVMPEEKGRVAEILARGEERVGEYRARRKDGTEFSTEAHGRVFEINQRRVRITSIRDITERKGAEEALKRSEEKFAKAFRSSPDLIVLTTLLDGRIVEANDRLQTLTGYTRDEIIGKTTSELQMWVDPSQRDRYVAHLMRDGYLRDAEVKFRFKSGNILDTLMSGEIIELQDGKYILVVIRDITEHKQAEMALRESEAKYRRIVDTTLEGIWFLDAQGRTTLVNARLADLLGYPTTDMLNRPITDFMFAEDWPDHQHQMAVCRQGRAETYERRLRRQDGQMVWTLVSGTPIFEETQRFAGSFAMLTDITARKQVEALQREMEVQMAVLHQMDCLRTELIGNVSHELRTPLGLILVMVTALHKDYIFTNPEMRDRILRDIEEEARNLQGIVDQLLDESHLRSGRVALDRRLVDVRTLIRLAVERQAGLAPRHRLSHQLPEAELLATLDESRIEQVLRNLLDNAIKYSPAGTAITVWASAEAETLRVTVGDEGPGIPAAERERIFERLYRIIDPQAPPVAGLGLGLSICRSIVEAHGGRLWVEERPGGGSLFVFTLPKGSEAAARAGDRRSSTGDRRKPASRDEF